ncbi:His-Xaa-Ser repeat protein HxsA [Litoribrevibacter albus]|uniref:His-Xaa-Ser repeat protein HxsA n=1 Tax=Litoribrevibacter albus TaxID=1473156 RepID=A0AA37W5Q0_9GAMM|nr:His-Xaa-Ser repeat protein HxsA [Litoribrevibacter albus]GLQ30745.1 hypothetical protein GCM10007876_12240 [Litoribrevibacter albus]
MKKWKKISLLPGFIIASEVDANAFPLEDTENPFNERVIAPLNAETPFYIAGHRSHSSHSSHSSHRSSSGSSYKRTPTYSAPRYNASDSLGQPSKPSYSQPATKAAVDYEARAALIKRVQLGLNIAGYYDGAIDGILGPKTREGILLYRIVKGLGSSDKIDADLLNALGIVAK